MPQADATGRLKEMFTKMDVDNNGSIDRVELLGVLKVIMPKHDRVTMEEVSQVLALADKNGNGKIEYDEFVDWVMMPSSRVQDAATENKLGINLAYFDLGEAIRPLFNVYDRNNNDVISKDEFTECYTILQNSLLLQQSQVGEPPDPKAIQEDVEATFAKADKNGDEGITFAEFVEWQRFSLAQSGLSHATLAEAMHGLSKQLERIFCLDSMNEKGLLDQKDEILLKKIIENIAHHTRDLWNEQKAASNPFCEDWHKNFWSEPPAGMSLQRLKAGHLASVPVQQAGDIGFSIFCVPATCHEQDAFAREWYAELFRTVSASTDVDRSTKNTDVGTKSKVDCEYYVYNRSSFNWDPLADVTKFQKAVQDCSLALRLFCLLKSAANFADTILWDGLMQALSDAVKNGFISTADRSKYIKHMEYLVLTSMMEEGAEVETTAESDVFQILQKKVHIDPRHVMIAFWKLGVLELTSAMVDYMDGTNGKNIRSAMTQGHSIMD